MKTIVPLFLLFSGMCFSQTKQFTTEISQEIRPDYNTSSHLIVTKMFARESDADAWIEIYEHETNVKKFRDSSEVKKEEYARAEEAGRQLLADGKIPGKMLPMLGNEPTER